MGTSPVDACTASADKWKAETYDLHASDETCKSEAESVAKVAGAGAGAVANARIETAFRWKVLARAWRLLEVHPDDPSVATIVAALNASKAWMEAAVKAKAALLPYAHYSSRPLRTPTTIDELPEEVIAEILVRLPPHPTCLLTESGTKQAWRQCMGSNYFRKLTLSHNRGNPLLGFFTNNSEDNRFISEHDLDPAILQTLTLPSDNSSSKSYVLGCRDGMVLLHSSVSHRGHITVWDPVRGVVTVIPPLPIWLNERIESGVILCSRNNSVPFTHRCKFWVVWITTSCDKALAHRYSSESGEWKYLTESTPMLAEIDHRPATVIGDILYWPTKSRYIIALHNVKEDLKYIECPHETRDIIRLNVHIFRGHNGDVALAVIRNFTLQTWSSTRSPTGDHESWQRHIKVELDTLLPIDTSFPYHGKCEVRLLCVVEDSDILVVWVKEGVFQLDMSHWQWKRYNSDRRWCTLHPYSVRPVTDLIQSAKSRTQKERALTNLSHSVCDSKRIKKRRI